MGIIEIINQNVNFYSKPRKVKCAEKVEDQKCQLIDELTNRKKIARNKFRETGNIEYKNEIKNVTHIIRKEKKLFEKDKKIKEYENCENNTTKMWKTAKRQIFGNNSKTPEKMVEN